MNTFPAKILLFGEHIINKGSKGLATPFHQYDCTLSFDKQENTLEASRLVLELILSQINKSEMLQSVFDTVTFEQDIIHDLNINMNIPVGYGLGSSGAICACVYEKYCHYKKENPEKIKKILGEIESAFHGKSSGLDPLVSFLNKSVLVSEESTEIIDFSISDIKDFSVFLIDTNKPRKTAPLVDKFLTKYKTKPSFTKAIVNEIIPLTNEIIDSIINKNLEVNLISSIKQLSKLHLEHFKDFIIEKHIPIWETALNNNDFYLKICGAGGGGFMLGFCEDTSVLPNYFKQKDIILIQ